MKLIIDNIYIKNFRSIGDDSVNIDLNKKGPILICGKNGSGKTSIIESIVWCLFGKLSDGQNPGDNIINFNKKQNCMVKITTSNGYEICRTRKYEGYSDLLINKDGNPIESGDSTNANAQETLNKLFNLDFNSFISSLFFGQSSGSFLTLSDTKKKSVIENLFGLSKLSYYAKVTKERINKCEELHTSIKEKIVDSETVIKSMGEEIEKYKSLSEDFENNRKNTIKEQEEEIIKLSKTRQDPVDVELISKSWETIDKGNDKINQLETQKEYLSESINTVINSITKLKDEEKDIKSNKILIEKNIKDIQDKIKNWKEKSGIVCPTCEQIVEKDFINKKVENVKSENKEKIKNFKKEINNNNNKSKEIKEKICILEEDKENIQQKINQIIKNVKKLKESIEKSKKDKMTISEAKKHNELVLGTDREIGKCKKIIKEEKSRTNNYDELIDISKNKIEDQENKISELKSRLESISKEATHLTYIYRAHSDKKNLRSFLISGSIPILNNRLSYYFNELNIESDIHFNQTLQIKSDRWPYNLHSGGEKKRVDLALMCSLYDTFTSMYGQKCNVLILDELDKEFDVDGVEEYVKLIIDDLSNRIDTILVISHKEEINYAFPTQIKVIKENNISYLDM